MENPIKRTPIKIKRTPIIIERLPWDTIYEKFINLIKFAASSVFNTFKTIETEDLFQEGQLILYKCWIMYGDRDESQFSSIFKASLWRKLRELSGKKHHFTVDFDTLAENGEEPGYENDFDLQIDDEEKLTRLAEKLRENPIALTILREFLNPSERTLWEIKMEIARKKTLKNQNYRVVIPTTISPSKKTIQRGMDISKVLFNKEFELLKEAVKEIYVN